MKTPKAVLTEWVHLMNTHEHEALGKLYHQNAVNIQIAIGTPLNGRAAIVDDFRTFFSHIPDTYTKIENLFENGEIVFQRGYWDKYTWFSQIGMPI